jgi:hypothetical protein
MGGTSDNRGSGLPSLTTSWQPHWMPPTGIPNAPQMPQTPLTSPAPPPMPPLAGQPTPPTNTMPAPNPGPALYAPPPAQPAPMASPMTPLASPMGQPFYSAPDVQSQSMLPSNIAGMQMPLAGGAPQRYGMPGMQDAPWMTYLKSRFGAP